MPNVSDLSLGSRIWVTDNLIALQDVFDNAEGIDRASDVSLGPIAEKKLPAIISGDSVLTSLAAGPESAKLKGTFAGAKLLGKLVACDGATELALQRYIDDVAQRLGIDREGFAKTIARMNRAITRSTSTEMLTDAEIQTAKNALDKVLSSSEMVRRSSQGELTRQGRTSLANATLGVIKLMRDGVIGEDSTSELFDGEIYDVTKRGDMLKLSAKTAKAARDIFVDRSALETIKNVLTSHVFAKLTGEAQESAMRKLNQLRAKIGELIQKREDASRILNFEADFGDGSAKAVKKGLKAAKNAMRAFRYDFDQVTGRHMDKMERFRRMVNNWQKRNGGYNVTSTDYRELVAAERQVAALVEELSDVCSLATDERMVVRTAEETSRDAGNLTHATNNHIRYCESEVGLEKEKSIAAICKDLDEIARDGGKKSVSFGLGLDAKFAIKVSDSTGVNASAALMYERKATVSVPPGGGPITVTYYDGGAVEAHAKGKVASWGKDDKKGAVSGGVSLSGNIGGGVGKGSSVTYASLRDFAEDVWGRRGEAVTKQGTFGQVFCLGRIAQAFRSMAHGVCNLVTAMGLRIHHTQVDSTSFRSLLRSSGAMSQADQMLADPLHDRVVRTNETSFVSAKFAAGAQVDVGLDIVRGFSKNQLDPTKESPDQSEIFSAKAGIGYQGERTFRAENTEFRSHLASLRLQSHDYLANVIDQLKTDHAPYIVSGNTRQERFRDLHAKLTALEDSAANQSSEDTEAWNLTAQRYRFLAVQYVMIEEEISQEINRLSEEDENSNAQRIAELKEELANATTFFENRLVAPKLNMPEDIFRAALMEESHSSSGGVTRHSVEFTVGYSALTKLAEDVVEDQIKGKGFKYDLARASATSPINTIAGETLLSTEVTGSVTTEKPNKPNDVRPWRNQRKTDIAIKLTSNLTIKSIVEAVSRKFIDSQMDDPQEIKASKMLIETAVGDILGMVLGAAVKTGIATYAHYTVEQVLTQLAKGQAPDEVKRFFGAPLMEAMTGEAQTSGIVPGFEMLSTKEFVFHFDGSRLAALTVENGESTTGKLGFHLPVAPAVGLGVVMTSGVDRKTIERCVYSHPSVDTMLSRVEDFHLAGNRQAFKDFLAHNRRGALRILRLFEKDVPGAEFESANDCEDARLLRERLDFVRSKLQRMLAGYGNASDEKIDRAKLILNDLERSVVSMRAANVDAPEMTDAKRLKALENHLNALVRGYELIREVGLS